MVTGTIRGQKQPFVLCKWTVTWDDGPFFDCLGFEIILIKGDGAAVNLTGLHHVSILTGKAERNFEFYTEVLGMRLVKKTVNQDNTGSYHLFYGDAKGNPGTEIAFFDMPNLGHTYHGVSSISSTALRGGKKESLHYWQERLNRLNCSRSNREKS